MKNSPLLHVAIAAFLLAATVLGYLAWYSLVQNTSERAVALQNELDLKQTETGRAVAAKNALGVGADGKAATAHFVSEKDVVPFLEEVQKIAAGVGAKTTIVSVAADENDADPSIRVSITILGSFDTVLRAIGLIEHSQYAIRTEMFDLKADTASADWTANTILLVSTPLSATSTPPTL